MPRTPEHTPDPVSGFALTEREQLFYRVTMARFRELLFHPATTIHSVDLSTNTYGEFLFVTVSRPAQHRREIMTFYGLGFHEQRDRWIQAEWFWYRSETVPVTPPLSQRRVEATIQEREREVHQYAENATVQSQHGQLFETLADTGDDDGASSMLDEMGESDA